MNMPSNTAVQHTRNNRILLDKLEKGISDAENPHKPCKIMFKKPEEMEKDPDAQNILESYLERGGGYCVKGNWIIRVDTW
jgi:hypothetical protein